MLGSHFSAYQAALDYLGAPWYEVRGEIFVAASLRQVNASHWFPCVILRVDNSSAYNVCFYY